MNNEVKFQSNYEMKWKSEHNKKKLSIYDV